LGDEREEVRRRGRAREQRRARERERPALKYEKSMMNTNKLSTERLCSTR
jgi:hypothetical protein